MFEDGINCGDNDSQEKILKFEVFRHTIVMGIMRMYNNMNLTETCLNGIIK